TAGRGHVPQVNFAAETVAVVGEGFAIGAKSHTGTGTRTGQPPRPFRAFQIPEKNAAPFKQGVPARSAHHSPSGLRGDSPGQLRGAGVVRVCVLVPADPGQVLAVRPEGDLVDHI